MKKQKTSKVMMFLIVVIFLLFDQIYPHEKL